MSKLPIHEQVRSYISAKISSGEWKPGQQIPSEREISELFQISRVTVRQALNNLSNEGLLLRVQGQGTFVATPKVEMIEGELISITTLMAKQGQTPDTILKKLSREALNAKDAKEMACQIGEDVYVIQRIRKADGVIIVLENTKLPYRKLPDIDRFDLVNQSIFTLMADEYGYDELIVHQTIEADVASEETANLLEIEPGSPISRVHRVVRDQLGEVVEYAQDFYPASRVRFVYNGRINLKESQQKYRGPNQPTLETY